MLKRVREQVGGAVGGGWEGGGGGWIVEGQSREGAEDGDVSECRPIDRGRLLLVGGSREDDGWEEGEKQKV